MTCHTLIFIKNYKVVDSIEMNGPVSSYFCSQIVEDFIQDIKKNHKQIYKKVWDRRKIKEFRFNIYSTIDIPLKTKVELYLKDDLIKICKGEDYKKIAPLLVYKKDGGWATEEDCSEIIDSKKDYDTVVYYINSECWKNYIAEIIEIWKNWNSINKKIEKK